MAGDPTAGTTTYTCPMHPEIRRDAPGDPPRCTGQLPDLRHGARAAAARARGRREPRAVDFRRRFWWTLPLTAIVRQSRMRQNLGFALVCNALGVPIAAGVLYPVFGLTLSPMIAALAMSLSSVSVVSNALRLRGSRS